MICLKFYLSIFCLFTLSSSLRNTFLFYPYFYVHSYKTLLMGYDLKKVKNQYFFSLDNLKALNVNFLLNARLPSRCFHLGFPQADIDFLLQCNIFSCSNALSRAEIHKEFEFLSVEYLFSKFISPPSFVSTKQG